MYQAQLRWQPIAVLVTLALVWGANMAIIKIGAEAMAAEDALRLSKSRYADGLSTYLPVLTAQTTYFDSRTRLLSARRQLVSARISLARALGGNWMSDMAAERLQAKNRHNSTFGLR